MHFSYTASSKDGRTMHGGIDAANRETAISMLARQGLKPIVVKIDNVKNTKGMFGKKVKNKDLMIFTRQLSTMIGAGVPLTRAISTLQSQTESKYFKEVTASIMKDVEGGIPLGEAFSKFPKVFSEVYVNMVKAGEAGGILDEILKRLAEQVEGDVRMRKKIKGAMTYPVVILSITVLAFFGIMTFVMPKLAKIIKNLAGPDTQLPIYSRVLIDASAFMKSHVVIIIVVNVLTVFFVRRYIRTPKGKYNFHALLLRTPIISNVVLKIAIARFARTFASLMNAGVSVLDALEVTGGAIGNKVIEKELKEAAKAVRNGKQLSEPLSTSPHFPAIVSQMLAVGEETGQIDTILVKVADFYEEEVETIIDSLSSIIEPLLIVFLGAMVGLIAASVMGPIANLNKQIGTN
ncbi:MAG: type II secretion system F family protein [Candidatus Saccharimonadales bacterium]